MKSMRKVFAWLSVIPVLAAPAFHLNPPRLPDAIVGKVYTGGPLVVEGGGQCPRNTPTVRVVTGALPPGMYLSPAGQFGGAPMEAGRYELVVRVENGCGWSDQLMTLEVTGAPILLANPAALEFRVSPGQAVSPSTIQVSSSSPDIAYSVESSAPWLRARPRLGRTPAAGSAMAADLVSVEIDTASLGPGQHHASIGIGAWRAGQPAMVPVRVEVMGPAPAATQTLADPRLPSISFGPVSTAPPPATSPAPTQAPRPKPAVPSGRLSRSAQLRSKYLASKAARPAAPNHPRSANRSIPRPPAAKPPKAEPTKAPAKH